MRNLIVFVVVILFSASCSEREGVEINGVRWATRNVDTPGTFVRNPSDAGGLFTWYAAQDACPRGWRLPTIEELQSLRAAGSEWTVRNGVNGRTFGTTLNSLFLPAAGWRFAFDDSLSGMSANGAYWSSTRNDAEEAVSLWFLRNFVSVHMHWRVSSRSVRCVAE